MKHTKGPWKAVKYQNTSYYTVRQDHSTYGIDARTLAGSDDDLKFHDAHLIAAAPEMLEALENILGSMLYAANFLDAPLNSTFRDNVKLVENAIKKARGES